MTKQLAYKIVGIVVVAAFVIGVLVYFGLVWHEKRQFAQAEKEIDSLHAQIVAKIGKPDQEKKEKSCGYASREFGKGPLSCGVSQYLLYESVGFTAANKKMFGISPLVGTSLNDSLGRDEITNFSRYPGRGADQDFVQSINNKTGLTCTIDYSYPVNPVFQPPLSPKSSENLLVSISCGGSAMGEYFPVDKQK